MDIAQNSFSAAVLFTTGIPGSRIDLELCYCAIINGMPSTKRAAAVAESGSDARVASRVLRAACCTRYVQGRKSVRPAERRRHPFKAVRADDVSLY